MGTPIVVAEDLRGFIRRVYAETASSVGQVFEEDGIAAALPLSHVRVCCGNSPINRQPAGSYQLPDNTPWLAELFFTKGSNGEAVSGNQTSTVAQGGSTVLSQLPLLRLQGTGTVWSRKFANAGITTIADLAAVSRTAVTELVTLLGSKRVIEFHAKSLLATAPCPPVPECPIMDLGIFELLQMDLPAITSKSTLLSEQDARRLITYLSTLVAVIDDQVLSSMLLRDLVK